MAYIVLRKWRWTTIWSLVTCGVLCAFMLTLLRSVVSNDIPLTRIAMDELLMTKYTRTPVTFLTQPKHRCPSNNATRLRMVIVVVSKMTVGNKRQMIRETWGNTLHQKQYNFRVFFLAGKSNNDLVEQENNNYGDIIQTDITEDYYTLTEKTIALLGWAAEFCPNAQYVFKSDDDVFLHVRRIMNQIEQIDASDSVIIGKCVVTEPFRFTSKWALTYEEYPFSKFPTYCAGPGYMMSMEAAKELYVVMLRTIAFKLEDVYVGMVAYSRNVPVKCVDHFLYDMDAFSYDLVMFYMHRQCTIVRHRTDAVYMEKFWKKYTEDMYSKLLPC